MANLDWIVLGLFCLALIGVIFWVLRKKDKNTSDYFLAGRDATWIAIGASIFASNIGSEHLVGLAGTGVESGMAYAHWEMHGWMILLLGWLFVPFYARSGVFTMPEFLEKRYNSNSRSFLSIISLVSYILTKVAVTVYAGGVVFKDVFNIDYITIFNQQIDFFWVSAIGLVLLTGLYTVFGGMKAVLYTSILQTPILLAGSIAILVIGLTQLGGWGNLMEIVRSTDATYLNDAGEVIYRSTTDNMASLIRSPGDPKYPWTGVILGSAIIGFWYWCTDQFIVQRVLSGRDQKQARRGTIFGAYLKLTPVFLFLIPGMIAFALRQQGMMDFSTNDAAFSTLVKDLLPKGFTGIVVGGILAALMSSLASLFNSSSMLFTVDFYQKFKPNASEKHYVLVGRLATVVVVILGILWIPVMKNIGKVLYEYLQDVQSLLAPGIAAVFLLGIISKKTTPTAGFVGLVVGFVLGMLRLGLNIYYGDVVADGLIYRIIIAPNWLHYEIMLFVLVILVMIIVSFFTKAKDLGAIQGLYFGSATAEQRAITRASWSKWDVINSAIIIAFIIAFYIYFW
ncbi:MAG: Na+/glucose cotransporter [Bacteroidia bacterium]|nr:MAG: Na+/glucose cotransporter [Bacteroidia bacterium]